MLIRLQVLAWRTDAILTLLDRARQLQVLGAVSGTIVQADAVTCGRRSGHAKCRVTSATTRPGGCGLLPLYVADQHAQKLGSVPDLPPAARHLARSLRRVAPIPAG